MENKRYHIIIASILFALVTWLSVNMRYDYTIVRNIPVILENEKAGTTLKYPVPKNMTVRFHGNGWMLAALTFSPDLKYHIDVSSLSRERRVVTAKDVLEHIKLPGSVQVVDIKPESLILALDEYREKRVKVIPNVIVNFYEGYGQVGPVTIAPENILIGGPGSSIDHVTGWLTSYQKFENLRAPVDMEIPLEESATYAVNVHQPAVRLTINVQPFAEKMFSGIPVTVYALPQNREVIFIPSKMDIIVRGGIDNLAALSIENFQATVNYQALVQDSIQDISPVLRVPDEVKVVSRKPERFQFIIRKRM